MVVLVTLGLGLFAISDHSYVGSEACGACHQRIYRSYVRTAMGSSLHRAEGPEQMALVPAPVVIKRFKVFRRGDGLYQSETGKDAYGSPAGEAVYKLEYVIGSGANGFAYMVARGQRLMEAPLSYYTRSKTWDLSPGYDPDDPGFQRPIGAACAGCHSGHSQPVPGRLGMYEDPPFLEMAIGCENCHGPGRDHALAPDNGSIVNPAKLSPLRQVRICAECHQDPTAAPDSELLTHYSSMRQSKCYAGSGGRLTCTTCHDPHVRIPPVKAANYYAGKCATCHAKAADHGTWCTECHMPKRQLGVIPHVALTNHRIPARQ